MMQPAQKLRQLLTENIGRVIVGKEGVVELILNAILCGGHVLIEDVPGVGKTTLASAFARSLALDYKRIQFTPDVTPSDVVGYTFIDFKTNVMEYRKGAVFANLLLADEINRTSPKTQSSLLEVMEEGQVTLDGRNASAAEAVHRAGYAEPRGLCGHVSAAGGTAGSILHARVDRLSD